MATHFDVLSKEVPSTKASTKPQMGYTEPKSGAQPQVGGACCAFKWWQALPTDDPKVAAAFQDLG